MAEDLSAHCHHQSSCVKLAAFEYVDSGRKFLACAEKVRPSFVVTNHLLDVIQTLSRPQPIHTTPSTKHILRQCHSLYLVSKKCCHLISGAIRKLFGTASAVCAANFGPHIRATATSSALRWFSLEEERMMQQTSVSIYLSF